jgi:hypothetical protein
VYLGQDRWLSEQSTAQDDPSTYGFVAIKVPNFPQDEAW